MYAYAWTGDNEAAFCVQSAQWCGEQMFTDALCEATQLQRE